MGEIVDLDREARGRLITVVSPMYNEGARIAEGLTGLFAALETLDRPWEVVLVNDGSTDDSLEQARKHADRPELTIVTYKQNRGRGYAIRQGLAKARGDVVVVTESDLSWGESIVERLVTKLEEGGYDVVVASVHHEGGGLANVPGIRRLYTGLGNKILRFLMPVKLTMYTGMTRAYRREILDGLALESDDKELHLELIAKLAAVGARMGEIPATIRWPEGRTKRKSSFKARRYIASHILFGMSESPFLLLSAMSIALIVAGLGAGGYLFWLSSQGVAVAGRPLLSSAVLLIMLGFLVLLFALIAQQNKRLERELYRIQRTLLKKHAGT